MNTDWQKMTADERLQSRFERWLSPDNITFASNEVKKAYASRVRRVIDAIELKKLPDRVPTMSPAGFLPCFLYGVKCRDVMYDADLAIELWERFAIEYPSDLIKMPGFMGIGRALEILDYKLYKWPGHGLGDNVCFQAMEGEWMKADEYDLLLNDPSDLWLRRYLPRVFGALEPLKGLQPLSSIIELPQVGLLGAFGQPGIREALNKLADAGDELQKVRASFVRSAQRVIGELGFVPGAGGGAKAPFDVIADTMRGSRNMILDMYRNKEKIKEAVEKITPLQIKGGVDGANASGNPLVFIPLHKGADGFMSDEQFRELYWPSLKAVILGLIEEGCIPYLFAEGSYSSPLKYLNELPKGKTLWLFDQTDMAEVKKTVGSNVCIAGNVPSSLMVTGTAQQVDDYCKKLYDDCAPGGGFMLSTGAIIDEGKAETARALVDAGEKYGSY